MVNLHYLVDSFIIHTFWSSSLPQYGERALIAASVERLLDTARKLLAARDVNVQDKVSYTNCSLSLLIPLKWSLEAILRVVMLQFLMLYLTCKAVVVDWPERMGSISSVNLSIARVLIQYHFNCCSQFQCRMFRLLCSVIILWRIRKAYKWNDSQ